MEKQYIEKHIWVKKEATGYRLGLTNEGQEELGNVSFVSLPKVGTLLSKDEAFADVEAEKAVTEFVTPFSGRVKEIHQAVLDNPSLLDNEVEDEAWLILLDEVEEA